MTVTTPSAPAHADFDAAAWTDLATTAVGMTFLPAWRDGVVAFVEIAAQMAALLPVKDLPVPDLPSGETL